MKRVRINPNHVVAIEEDGEEMCIVTPVKAYCAPRDRVRLERDMLGNIYLVVEGV